MGGAVVVVVELVVVAAVVAGRLVVVVLGGRVVLGAVVAAVVGGAVGAGAATVVGAGRVDGVVVVLLRRTLVSGAAVAEAGAARTVACGHDAPRQGDRGLGLPNACRERITTIKVAATAVATQGFGRRDTSTRAAATARLALSRRPPPAALRGATGSRPSSAAFGGTPWPWPPPGSSADSSCARRRSTKR